MNGETLSGINILRTLSVSVEIDSAVIPLVTYGVKGGSGEGCKAGGGRRILGNLSFLWAFVI